ncbi:hypothetical protein ABE42_13685 [Bacillus thuringiensis]|uniref:Uncharacterized protein n=1 Tax=Bacillus thuringiensis YBT-1518 TaxID=529122 RepID=A0A9W3KBZ1_BACTU|nr:hypothetical protein [Bacillus thuringiensis]EKS8367220.1 hypothetical protein [Bacillus cereus]AGC39287.1 hypothetical protein YBT1518_p00010 [Bacillus thuringiensis YBT-1518]MBG9484775.1 hypothetical protein [Bacillus thuringiensis]MBG9580227.1 hypothetical protein [Bacillus thuringiensis]PGL21331.1 hypothetical protein CN916_27310 [Bacillus thuringiensis]
MQITLEQTVSGKKFLNIVFGKTPQDFNSAIRIALSSTEYQILFLAGIRLYETYTPECFPDHFITKSSH